MTDSEYETSERLKTLDTEIADTTARLEAIQNERGAALNAKATGDDGADQTLADLRDERTRLENYLGDTRAARELEAERLQQAHSEAVAQAQEARRAEIQSACKQVSKVATKADKAVDSLITALQELEQAGSGLARVHCRGAGNSVSREALAVIQDRLTEYAGGSREAPNHRVAGRMPGAGVVETAAIPDTLAELPDAQ